MDLRELGQTLARHKGYLEARKHLAKALQIHETFEPDGFEVAADLDALFEVFALRGDIAEARSVLERALSIREKLFGHDDVDTIMTRVALEVFRGLLVEGWSNTSAIERYVAQSEQTFGLSHPRVAEVYELVSDAAANRQDWEAAQTYLERSLEVNKSAYGRTHPRIISNLFRLFRTALALGQIQRAGALTEEAIGILKEVRPEDLEATIAQADVATALSPLSELDPSARPAARTGLERSLEMLRHELPAARTTEIDLLEVLAQLAVDQGERNLEKDLLSEALEIVRSTDMSELEEARLLSKMAAGEESPAKALLLWTRVLEVERRELGPDHYRLFTTYSSLWPLLLTLNRVHEARSALEEGIRIAGKTFGPDHWLLEQMHEAQSVLSAYGGDMASAVDARRKALAAAESNPNSDQATLVVRLMQLAETLQVIGGWEEALELLHRGLEIQKDAKLDEGLRGTLHLRLADSLIHEGDYSAALASLKEAARVVEIGEARQDAVEEAGALSPGREQIVEGWSNLGDALLASGQPSLAIERYQLGLQAAALTETPLDDAQLHVRLAVLAGIHQQDDSAKNHLERALKFIQAAQMPGPLWGLLISCSRVMALTEPPQAILRLIRELVRSSSGAMMDFRGKLTGGVPDGWFAKESLTFVAPDGQANVIASSEPLDETIRSEEYAQIQGDLLQSEFPEYAELSFEPAHVFGRAGFVRYFRWTPPDGVSVTQIQFYHADTGRGFTATATTPTINFDSVGGLLRLVLDALVIGDDAAAVNVS